MDKKPSRAGYWSGLMVRYLFWTCLVFFTAIFYFAGTVVEFRYAGM